MEISKYILLMLFFLQLTSIHAQLTEDQRKFSIQNNDSIYKEIESLSDIGDFSLLQHSKDIYYDIYLDSPDFTLKKHGFSLRFRKRITQNNDISYSFQLKSEMNEVNSIRLEAEEDNLELYQFIQGTNKVSLIALLEPLFQYTENQVLSDVIQLNIQTINEWINFKFDAPILPFQLLKNNGKHNFSKVELLGLKPILVGRSERMRFHGVFNEEVNDSLTKMYGYNRLLENELPEHLKNKSGLNWIFEASLDKSTFYTFQNRKVVQLSELEIENKFNQPSIGVQLIDAFEKELLLNMKLSKGSSSKYVQAVNVLSVDE